MTVTLAKAVESDAEALHNIQIQAFLPSLEKYEDMDTSPANEGIEKTIGRITSPQGGFYKIVLDDVLVGGIRATWKEEKTRMWLGPFFILPAYQGKGIAQRVLNLIMEMFPQAAVWELATIAEEERNCWLYEKMGFAKTGEYTQLNDKATLVFYRRIG
ncbi:GNAT family N-acetyltransferase [Paenibacillus sp. GCM10012306]|uniref:GNAT family N-acetyltransferase n=1 Tax=Paenibacillus sp. GCM10012306 TaxID=3317342 RepID=UPI00361FEC57